MTVFEKIRNKMIEQILNLFFHLSFLRKINPARLRIHQVLGYRKIIIIFDNIKNIVFQKKMRKRC